MSVNAESAGLRSGFNAVSLTSTSRSISSAPSCEQESVSASRNTGRMRIENLTGNMVRIIYINGKCTSQKPGATFAPRPQGGVASGMERGETGVFQGVEGLGKDNGKCRIAVVHLLNFCFDIGGSNR